jgi:hypothetical protein
VQEAGSEYLTVADFFNKVCGLANELVVADAALRDEEILAYLFCRIDYRIWSLCHDDNNNVVHSDPNDVFAHLMAFEARQLRHHVELQLNLAISVHRPMSLAVKAPTVAGSLWPWSRPDHQGSWCTSIQGRWPWVHISPDLSNL